jgi:predicted phage-related endonuclease
MTNHVLRRSFIGGSDARIIMGADEPALLRLWREKRGEVEPEDLSANLIVQLGQATEDLNRLWYERNTGQAVKDVQRRVLHPVNRWMAATLDGMVDGTVRGRAATAADRSGTDRRHDRIQFLGRIGWGVLSNPRGLPGP